MERLFQRFTLYAAHAEVDVLKCKDQKCGDKPYADADDKPLPVYLVGAALSHRAHLAGENDPDARRDEITEEGHNGGHRCDRVDPGNARFAYEKAGDDAVAEQHQVHHRLGERAGYQHRAEFIFTEAMHNTPSYSFTVRTTIVISSNWGTPSAKTPMSARTSSSTFSPGSSLAASSIFSSRSVP